MQFNYLRYVISFCAIAAIAAHLIWPNLTIDEITIALILIAIVPWISSLLKSVELPSGLKIEFQDVKDVEKRAKSSGLLLDEPKKIKHDYSFLMIANEDPNLALAGLRIEIERRLKRMADQFKLDDIDRFTLRKIMKILLEKKAITAEDYSILNDLMTLLNSAVHGAKVDRSVAEWAIEVGPKLLGSMDTMIERLHKLSGSWSTPG